MKLDDSDCTLGKDTMMKRETVLGVHDGHNASAAILSEGKIIAAVQEERLSRNKNHAGVPQHAIVDVLSMAGLDRHDIRNVALAGAYMTYDHWEREQLLQVYEHSAGFTQYVRDSLKDTPIDKYYQSKKAQGRVNRFNAIGFEGRQLSPIDHHTCHASAAYFGSGWKDEVLVLTCDGSGDRISATVSIGRNGRIERLAAINESESIGDLYAMVTYYMGMMPLEHEYKIMGLAPYMGDNSKAKRFSKMFSDLFEFDPKAPLTWKRRKGVPPIHRSYGLLRSLLYRQRFDSIAAGLQQFTEDMLTIWVRNCVRETGIHRVACSGGVFMNVKANKEILSLPEVEELFIFPSCGDETNSIGSSYHVYAQHCRQAGKPIDIQPLQDLYLGGSFSDADVESSIAACQERSAFKHKWVQNIEQHAAEFLARGEVVARAKSRMEFGARGLGNRSILARADSRDAVRHINDMIKSRDFWMPFAPSVLQERAHNYYQKPKAMSAPYMIIAFDSLVEARHKCVAAQHPYDYSVRPQEVTEHFNPEYYRLLKYYEECTGEGIILNTSFNLHGYPVVYNPKDALEVFSKSGLRCLALGNWWIWKE
jgi:carbamoyltransferase